MPERRGMWGGIVENVVAGKCLGIGMIQDLLRAWGTGRSINHAPNGFPSKSAFARLIARGNISLPPLSEEEHHRIDLEVSQMRHRKPAHHQIICLSYVEGWTDAQIARRWRFDGRRSRTWVREQRLAAESYLEAKLE